MSGEDSKAVMFPLESLYHRALCQIPHSDGLVLSATDDQLVFRMEHSARDVEMSPARIHLPRLGLAHPPELDLPVICGRNDERECRVEHGVVDVTVVSLGRILRWRRNRTCRTCPVLGWASTCGDRRCPRCERFGPWRWKVRGPPLDGRGRT